MKEREFSAEEIYLAPEKSNKDIIITDNMSDEIILEKPSDDKKQKTPFEVGEIPKMRKENMKVFRMSDGTEKAVFYPEALHVYNESEGHFESVDNTLHEEEDGHHLRNEANHFVARFSKEPESDELFAVEKDGCKLTVLARRNNKAKKRGIAPKMKKRELGPAKEVEKDVLSFENVLDGSDLEYSVTGNGVKEDIIIKEKAAEYRYPFVLECENVTAEFKEDEKIVIFRTRESDEVIFTIPAPFMTDANGVSSTAVAYEVKEIAEDKLAFTVTADSDWLNSDERAFPVAIDPQILVKGSSNMNTYSWGDGYLYSSNIHTVGSTGDAYCNAKRMYLNFKMPTLPRNPRIKKAELTLKQASAYSSDCVYPKIGLYHVTEDIITGYCTPAYSTNLIDFAKIKDGSNVSYTFDITTLVDCLGNGESSTTNLMLKLLDESTACNNYINIYGSSYSYSYQPTISITYENSYAVNASYRTNSHEIGRFGQGSIDLKCGNLMFDSEDFAWAGNRMPVTIKHLFNSALAGYQYTYNSAIKLNAAYFSSMQIGHGWKLNIMQSMMYTYFQHEGTTHSGYVYTDENGEETYFKLSSRKSVCDCANNCCYNLYEDVNGNEMYYDPYKLEMTFGDEVYLFDGAGRLIKVTDADGNNMVITYTSGKITSVTDGAGRKFMFVYDACGFLKSIVAPDKTAITYGYTDNLLGEIIYPDGKKAVVAYSSNRPSSVTLHDANGDSVYKVVYSFNGDKVYSVTEYGSNGATGAMSTYNYSIASSRTRVTTTEQKDETEDENNVITTTYTFDDDGNVISEYVYSTDTGNVGGDGEESGINPHSGNGGAGIASNINNLLTGHNFESLSAWTGIPCNCGDFKISNYAYESHTKFGKKVLRMQSSNTDCEENGVYQLTNILPAGKYTFSSYIRVVYAFSGNNPGAFIRVTDIAGNVLGVSERLVNNESDYTRLIVPFEIDTEQRVQVQILVNGKGTAFADAAQLENNPYANAYNMLENGNFERGVSGWTCSSGVGYSTSTRFNMSRSLYMNGSVEYDRYAYQQPIVRTNRSTRETFTLSGWAKGYGLPNHEREGVAAPRFRLRAVIKYKDSAYKEYGSEEFVADFSPCTEEWQFASVQFSKSKKRIVEYIRVYCDYGYNSGTVYFDDIQLVRNSIESSFSDNSYDDVSANASDDVVEENTNTTPTFNEAKDKFGNALTETTFTDGDFGTIYRSFKFNADDDCMAGDDAGNNLIEETDARGHKTTYTVDGDTSRNKEVTDRLGNKTAYEYDNSGRTTKVTSKDAAGTELAHVSYSYDTFDNMTLIHRGDGMKYALAYNEFHNLESIGIDGKAEKLIQYTYKNGNGRLKEMKYANGDTMKATYNSIGQMVAETWFDKNGVEIARYKYVYDGDGNIVRSIDIQAKKEYNYEYEEGRVIRATEADIELSGEIVTSKVIVNAVKYYYDTEGKMAKKVITPAAGSAQTIYYETNDDNTVVKFSAGGRTVTSHSKTDSFGRKAFDELQLGTDFVSRQFVYHAGKVTDTHKTNAKVKSSATTQLVSQIILSDGRIISYEYDNEERIIKVDDTIDGIVEYTYDALGQLLTETVNGKVVNSMKYDNYGNIVEKNGKAYTYGDAKWKDLLTSFDGKTIEYDAQGNPTSYLSHTLTWEKGRQLKSFDGNTYTYNANGIRTSKIVNGIKHEYTLDGTKILRETWNGNTLIPLYDNEDSVCGILYNNVPYYFIKNLQGDVIAIVDKDAQTVARYSYDAWGAVTSAVTYTDLTNDVEIAIINPFRYRCYYYDEEIELYYLQSRYYDASTGSFINEDATPQISFVASDAIASNMYSYCSNSPSNMCDESGFYGVRITFKIMSSIVSAFSGAYIGAAVATYFGLKGWKKALCMVGGAALMGLVGWFFPLANLYAAVKRILYTAGCGYLSIKGYSIASMAYSHGMWGAGYSLSSNQKQKFINKIKGCREYNDMKSKLVNRYEKGEKSPKDTIEFVNDPDLYYAIQHMSITLTCDSQKKKHKITMYDIYDFDAWRKIFTKTGISFANAANNLGLLMQKCGMMIPYTIKLEFYD